MTSRSIVVQIEPGDHRPRTTVLRWTLTVVVVEVPRAADRLRPVGPVLHQHVEAPSLPPVEVLHLERVPFGRPLGEVVVVTRELIVADDVDAETFEQQPAVPAHRLHRHDVGDVELVAVGPEPVGQRRRRAMVDLEAVAAEFVGEVGHRRQHEVQPLAVPPFRGDLAVAHDDQHAALPRRLDRRAHHRHGAAGHRAPTRWARCPIVAHGTVAITTASSTPRPVHADRSGSSSSPTSERATSSSWPSARTACCGTWISTVDSERDAEQRGRTQRTDERHRRRAVDEEPERGHPLARHQRADHPADPALVIDGGRRGFERRQSAEQRIMHDLHDPDHTDHAPGRDRAEDQDRHRSARSPTDSNHARSTGTPGEYIARGGPAGVGSPAASKASPCTSHRSIRCSGQTGWCTAP